MSVRSLLTPAVFVLQAGDEILTEQKTLLVAICKTSPLFADLSEQQLHGLVAAITRELRENDPDVTIPNAVSILTPPLRETALTLAIVVAHINGAISAAQTELLELLAKQMSVPGDLIQAAKTVSLTLQRDAEFST